MLNIQHYWSHYLKRLTDIIGAITGLLLCLPLWGVSAILIVLDSPGPVFYRQVRLGKNRKPFTLWKLRTMIDHAERASGPVWSNAGDARITGTGKWLRRFHIDETPQFWNVLRGDMSLIGPRPERPEIIARIEKACPDYHNRHRVLPGITGLAQVNSGYDSCIADVRRKIKYDILYCRKCCALLDLMILWRTYLVIVRG